MTGTFSVRSALDSDACLTATPLRAGVHFAHTIGKLDMLVTRRTSICPRSRSLHPLARWSCFESVSMICSLLRDVKGRVVGVCRRGRPIAPYWTVARLPWRCGDDTRARVASSGLDH